MTLAAVAGEERASLDGRFDGLYPTDADADADAAVIMFARLGILPTFLLLLPAPPPPMMRSTTAGREY